MERPSLCTIYGGQANQMAHLMPGCGSTATYSAYATISAGIGLLSECAMSIIHLCCIIILKDSRIKGLAQTSAKSPVPCQARSTSSRADQLRPWNAYSLKRGTLTAMCCDLTTSMSTSCWASVPSKPTCSRQWVTGRTQPILIEVRPNFRPPWMPTILDS